MGVAARVIPNPYPVIWDATASNKLASGLLYTYEPDTTTLKTTWKDPYKTTEHANPIVLDSNGMPPSPIFGDGLYDFTYKTAADATIRTAGDVGETWSAVGTDLSSNPLSNHSFETAGSGGESFANWTDTDSLSDITRDTSDSQHGVASCKFTTTRNGTAYTTSDAFEIDELQEVSFALDVKANNATCQPKVEINWLDSAQSAVSTSTLYSSTEGKTPTSWTRLYGFNATPPSTARYATLAVYGNQHSTNYTINFDNLVIGQYDAFSGPSPRSPQGLILSRDSDTDHDLNITAGAVKSSDYAEDMVLRTEITKKFDAAWAIGDDAGGTDGTSLPADGIWYVWLIKNPTTGNVDVLGSTSPTSPSMPSGYSVKRLIGAWWTDSSNNFIGGVHRGDYFYFYERISDVSDTSVTSGTWETGTATAPPNSILLFLIGMNYDAAHNKALNGTGVRPVGSADTGYFIQVDVDGNDDTDEHWGAGEILLDSSSQFEYTGFNGGGAITGTLTVESRGFIMLTRSSP